jgi:hypothetical protein
MLFFSCFFFTLLYSVSAVSDPPVELFKPVNYGPLFNGVVRAGGCTGSLIKTWENNPKPGTSAFVLTAGHCFGDFMGADKGKVLFDDTRFSGRFVYTNDFDDAPPNVSESFPIKIVRFSTMNLTDIAIIELNVSVQRLLDKGYSFYDISDYLPVTNNLHNQVGYPGGFSMTSTDVIVGIRVAFVESWGHEIEMAYSFDGGVYPGFSGSSNFLGNVITAITTHRSGPVNGFSQRVDYINPCFENGNFNFERQNCFFDYKVRFFERFGVSLPGLNNTNPPPKKDFGDDITTIITDPIDTELPKKNNGTSIKPKYSPLLFLYFFIFVLVL